MPLYLNFWERTGLLRLNQGPGPMAELLGVLSFKAVLTAIRLGLFEYLKGNARNIDTIAAGTGSPQTGLSILLRTLETLGYVTKK